MLLVIMRILISILIFVLVLTTNSYSDESFNRWLSSFKKYAINQGVSENTVNEAFKNTKLLKRIITYDRNQPEFIEKTDVYISKRVNNQKILYAKKLIIKNDKLLKTVEKDKVLNSQWSFEVAKGFIDKYLKENR